MKYTVTVMLEMTYEGIEAENEEDAKDIAYEYFSECEPDFIVTKD